MAHDPGSGVKAGHGCAHSQPEDKSKQQTQGDDSDCGPHQHFHVDRPFSLACRRPRYRRDHSLMAMPAQPVVRKAAVHHLTGRWAHRDGLWRDSCSTHPSLGFFVHLTFEQSAEADSLIAAREHLARLGKRGFRRMFGGIRRFGGGVSSSRPPRSCSWRSASSSSFEHEPSPCPQPCPAHRQ